MAYIDNAPRTAQEMAESDPKFLKNYESSAGFREAIDILMMMSPAQIKTVCNTKNTKKEK